MNWYRKAAEQGDPGAQNALAVLYSLGRGVPKDYVEAFNWYMKAASQGYGPALYNVAAAYYNGEGTTTDPIKSYEYFALAKRRGENLAVEAVVRAEQELSGPALIKAKFELIDLLESASWLATRLQEAAGVYRDLADKGNNVARVRLARLYLEGRGVEKSAVEAEQLCRGATKARYPPGMVCLAYLYQSSELGAPRYAEALQLYREAADSGNPIALYSLAALYGNGRGVKQDKVKALVT